MKYERAGKSGFSLVEIMIVVAIIGLLASIAIPNYVKGRAVSQKHSCVANLTLLDGVKRTWALELKKLPGDTPAMTDLVGANRYMRQAPECPGGGSYVLHSMAAAPTCSLDPSAGHKLPFD